MSSAWGRACARSQRKRRKKAVLGLGALMCGAALASAYHWCGTYPPCAENLLRSDIPASEIGAAFLIGALLIWRGRINRRLGRQVAGVLLGVAGVEGTLLLIELIDHSAGSLQHLLLDNAELALPALVSPALLWCAAVLVCVAPARPRHRRCRVPELVLPSCGSRREALRLRPRLAATAGASAGVATGFPQFMPSAWPKSPV